MSDTVKILELTKSNFNLLWPSLNLAIQQATFVSLDLEMTGLGNRKKLRSQDVVERYATMREAAITRAIISVGICCIRALSGSTTSREANGIHKFSCHTFNILTLPHKDYVVEPLAMQFLRTHGFDFNRLYSSAVEYDRSDTRFATLDKLSCVFEALVLSKKPLVLHNGVIDLAFLYQHFYADLPPNLDTWMADLSELFPSGIYDTKFVAEFELHYSLSFLEYVFRRCQRENERSMGAKRIGFEFPTFPDSILPHVACIPCAFSVRASVTDKDVCQHFSTRGNCPSGYACTKIHHVELFIEKELDQIQRKREKRKRRKRGGKDADIAASSMITGNQKSTNKAEQLNSPDCAKSTQFTNGTNDYERWLGIHRAGFDAYMTGYAFAFLVPPNVLDRFLSGDDFVWSAAMNKLLLLNKNHPLTVQKSTFSSTSRNHRDKLGQIM